MIAKTENLITTLIMIINFSIPLAKTDIFHSVSLSNGKKYLPYIHETPSLNTLILTWILTRHFNRSLFL